MATSGKASRHVTPKSLFSVVKATRKQKFIPLRFHRLIEMKMQTDTINKNSTNHIRKISMQKHWPISLCDLAGFVTFTIEFQIFKNIYTSKYTFPAVFSL